MNKYDFEGRTAIVTGGGQGIGLAVVNRILASGGNVSIWDRDGRSCGKTVSELGMPDRVQGLPTDIADLAAVQSATAATAQKFGKIDVLINNAAIVGPNANTWEYPPEAFARWCASGLIGTFHCCRRGGAAHDRREIRAYRQCQLGRGQGGQTRKRPPTARPRPR
jgi:3-oxoacyl-[acyl-carrier protein] reductase